MLYFNPDNVMSCSCTGLSVFGKEIESLYYVYENGGVKTEQEIYTKLAGKIEIRFVDPSLEISNLTEITDQNQICVVYYDPALSVYSPDIGDSTPIPTKFTWVGNDGAGHFDYPFQKLMFDDQHELMQKLASKYSWKDSEKESKFVDFQRRKLVMLNDRANYIKSTATKTMMYGTCLTLVHLPALTELGGESISNSPYLSSVVLSSMTKCGFEFAQCNRLPQIYVDNEKLTMIDDGFGDNPELSSLHSKDCIVGQKVKDKAGNVTKVVLACTTCACRGISSDIMYSLKAWLFANQGAVRRIYAKNLSSLGGGDTFYGMNNLELLDVDNSVMKSIDDGEGHRIVLVTPDGKKLLHLPSRISRYSTSDIEDVDSDALGSSNLSVVDINSDSLSSYNHKLLCRKTPREVSAVLSVDPITSEEKEVYLTPEQVTELWPEISDSLSVKTIMESTQVVYFAKGYGDITEEMSAVPTLTSITSMGLSRRSDLREICSDTIVQIGSSGCGECTKLSVVSFPNLTLIGEAAFSHAGTSGKGLSCYLPKITKIPTSLFYHREKVDYPFFLSAPEVTSIGGTAFSNRYGIKRLSFPKCTTLMNSALAQLYRLEEVYMPELTSIGTDTFLDDANLTGLTCGMTSSEVATRWIGAKINENCYVNCYDDDKHNRIVFKGGEIVG